MPEHWPEFRLGRSNPEEAEASEEQQASEDELGDPPAMAVEPAGEASISTVPDDAAAALAEQAAAEEAATVGDEGGFLAELVRTLQTTAAVERARIAEDTERRRQTHIDGIRARQSSEEARIRDLAGEDMKAIDAWADGETARIQAERERRATKLQNDLETSLAEHNSRIDREIDGVETKIAAYRADVDVFFLGLDRESDLVLIAQRATRRPVFPKLDAVPGETEPAVVGVMSPAAAERAESWAARPETSPEPASAQGSDGVDEAAEVLEPAESVTAVPGRSHGRSGSLFQSVSVQRPGSRIERDPNDEDRSNHES